ncbi:phasin family protein [Microvirga solisilvae]|uniref:phasin family protein n=1 Tax=Microvirga solisilvae TaxID=2919498 RepID=UPI001FAEFC20|nr:phasin family protein [Microvirga solisilvae]
MTETKKTRTRKPAGAPKSAPKADLVEMAAASVAEVTEIVEAAEPVPAPKPSVSAKTKAKESEPLAFSLKDQGEAFRLALREAASVSAKGALEVNDKIIEALQAQGHAALDLWRTAIDTSRQPDGFNVQTGVARQAFETASAQWKDVAETTARWMTKSVEPLQSALLRHR